MFFVIVAIIVLFIIAATLYFCVVVGGKADDRMKKAISKQSMICMDCGKIFTMEQWEIRCCCPDPECHSYNVELCKKEKK